MPPTAGVFLVERYRLESRIAGGGMGEVWRAQDEVLGRTVAIKLLRPELADDEQFRQRFRREARSAGAISHRGVVPIFDYGEIARDNASSLAFLVMEFIDGPSLADELRQHGALGVDRTLLILEQTAAALEAAHNTGVVHRDVKPGNILIAPSGDVKIADFGIAHTGDATALTRTGTLTGTAQYLSPEQAAGETATESSDIYSLGIVAYTCLSGSVPFSEGNELSIALAQLNKEPPPLPDSIPTPVAGLVMSMLEKNPASRPASAGAVAAAASELRGALPQATAIHPFSPPTRVDAGPATRVAAPAAPTAQKSSRILPIAALGVVAAVLLGVLIAALGSDGSTVPGVVGKQQSAATVLLEEAGLVTKVKTADVQGKSKGVVVAQSTKAGTELDEGTAVTLTVASGKVKVPLEKLQGATLEEAERILRGLGLEVEPIDQFSSSSTPGTVLAVSPRDVAPIGSTVQLAIAYGAGSDDEEGESDSEKKRGNDKRDKGDD